MVLSNEDFNDIRSAASDRAVVRGATHKFYRYPARFSPQFARAAIETFTNQGDLVLDPFVGGGTTAVEALRANRRCVGTDINELAVFVSEVKSTILGESETAALREWLPSFERSLKVSRSHNVNQEWRDKGYFRHLEGSETWRHRNIISVALSEIERLSCPRLEKFARCVVLRSAQLSLDGRRKIMSVSELREKVFEHFVAMLEDMDQLRAELGQRSGINSPTILKCNSSQLHEHEAIATAGAPKLIVTSPPYPGVHVLYHRWQVNGRRETPAPYWIANKLDGDGERYYTLGNRHEKELKTYFANLEAIFSSIAQISGQDTIIVQMVAFSEPNWQLPKYLEVMERAGLTELSNNETENSRIWRDVPNRKWHAERQERRAGSREVVLFHKKS
jgi:hypothetical protein